MRGLGVVLAAALAFGVTACGGDDSRQKAGSAKTVTSEFLTTQGKKGYLEASTPGSGGFIETPQRAAKRDVLEELEEDVPEIRTAPGGESVFTGVHRDTYLRARAACRRVPPRKLARKAGVDSTKPVVVAGAYAGRYRVKLWQPAFEGCVVGFSSR